MKHKLCCVLGIIGSSLAFSIAASQSNETLSDNDAILAIIAAIEMGWEQGDGTPFREHFLDFEGARYFESGGQNVGLDDLITHHVEPEAGSLALELEFKDPQINIEGRFAWVLFDTEISAKVIATGREIHNKGRETMILRKVNGEWKVLHTHSSSRPVKTHSEQEQDQEP